MSWTSRPSGCTSATTVRLLQSLRGLRDLGNSVLVVEHDEEAIVTADHVIDMGPAGGVHGGEIVAQGPAQRDHVEPQEPDRQVPDGRARDRRCPKSAAAGQEAGAGLGASGNNLKTVTGEIPGGGLHLHHRRLRRGQVHRSPSRRSTRRPRVG
jgi:excinuclease ABC subunit A